MALCNTNFDAEEIKKVSRITNFLIKKEINDNGEVNAKVVAKKMYDKVLENTENHLRALDYAAVTAQQYQLHIINQPLYQNYIKNPQEDASFISKLLRSDSLKVVESLMGLSPQQDKKEGITEDVQPSGTSSSYPPGFVIDEYRPYTIFATTWQERVDSKVNEKDPSMSFYYNFMNKLHNDPSIIRNYPGLGDELKITIMNGSALPINKRYPRHQNDSSDQFYNFPLMFITDRTGAILYFDKNHNIVSDRDGMPIYFTLRTRPDQVAGSVTQEEQQMILSAKNFVNRVPGKNVVISDIITVSRGNSVKDKPGVFTELSKLNENIGPIIFDNDIKQFRAEIIPGKATLLFNKNVPNELATKIAEILYNYSNDKLKVEMFKGKLFDINVTSLFNYYIRPYIYAKPDELNYDINNNTVLINGKPLDKSSKEEFLREITDFLTKRTMFYDGRIKDSIVDLDRAISMQGDVMVIDRNKIKDYKEYMLDYFMVNEKVDSENKLETYNSYIIYKIGEQTTLDDDNDFLSETEPPEQPTGGPKPINIIMDIMSTISDDEIENNKC